MASVKAFAQTEASDYSRIGFTGYLTSVASDYQCVGINPANLGFVPQSTLWRLASPVDYGVVRSKHAWSFTALEGGISLHSDALNRAGLSNLLTQTSSGTFNEAEKIRAASDFAGKGVRFSVDVIIAGASYQSDSWGGIALTLRERISGTFRFNKAAAQLAFQGRNFEYFDSVAVNVNGDTIGYSTNPQSFSEIFDDTRLAMLWFREIGGSYGIRIVNFEREETSIYFGIGLKYLMGYAMIDALTDNGKLKAYSALAPFFGISYGKATSPSLIPGTDYQHIGNGWSTDLGVTVNLGRMTVGMSVVDIGQIIWNGNVFQAKDTILNGVTSTGFSSYNIFEEAPKITGDGYYFTWDGLNSKTTTLPSRLRIGGSFEWSQRWRFGLDVIYPLNTEAGSLGEPIVSAGADWQPEVWMKVGVGLGGGGNMGVFVPIGVTFSLFNGLWEMGITSRDVLTYFVTDRPILSGVIGLARFRL
jgi:hypothetical protein